MSCVVNTASLRDRLVFLVTWSAQRSGGRPLGRRHDEDGVEASMTMAWVPGCRRHITYYTSNSNRLSNNNETDDTKMLRCS